MDIIKVYESDNLIMFEVYYNNSHKYDSLIIVHKAKNIIYRTKAEIVSMKRYSKYPSISKMIKNIKLK